MSLPVRSVSTADIVAAARAWHLRGEHPIFSDTFAHLLCGPFFQAVLRFRTLEKLVFKIALAAVMPVHLCVVMRARYAEEALERAIEDGVKQYVIIGAGMDSFAFRRGDLLEKITSYEIDHPVTQGKKLKRIKKAGLVVPPNHHFVAADLSQISTVQALRSSSFDETQPTFLSLLGVAYYLTPQTLTTTVRSIAGRLPAGSRLVLDYMLDVESSDPAHLQLRQNMLDFVAKRGEPMQSEYSLREMDALMEGGGLSPVESFAITDLGAAYRQELGVLPFEIPGLFAFGNFEVAANSA